DSKMRTNVAKGRQNQREFDRNSRGMARALRDALREPRQVEKAAHDQLECRTLDLMGNVGARQSKGFRDPHHCPPRIRPGTWVKWVVLTGSRRPRPPAAPARLDERQRDWFGHLPHQLGKGLGAEIPATDLPFVVLLG